MGWGGIGLDASNVGGGDSAVGVVSEQVSSGFHDVNYGERANPSVHEGFIEVARWTGK